MPLLKSEHESSSGSSKKFQTIFEFIFSTIHISIILILINKRFHCDVLIEIYIGFHVKFRGYIILLFILRLISTILSIISDISITYYNDFYIFHYYARNYCKHAIL